MYPVYVHIDSEACLVASAAPATTTTTTKTRPESRSVRVSPLLFPRDTLRLGAATQDHSLYPSFSDSGREEEKQRWQEQKQP